MYKDIIIANKEGGFYEENFASNNIIFLLY